MVKISKWNKRKLNNGENPLLRNISSIAHDSYYTFNNQQHLIPLLPDDYFDAIKNLKNDHSIKIIRPDKGKGVVILNTTDYNSKMQNILNDTSKFVKLNKDPGKEVRRLEDKVRRAIDTLLKKNLLTLSQYKEIYPSGSSPALLYGLPKVHKPNLPLSPIMSSLNTYNRKLSEFLVPILMPLTTNMYTVKNVKHSLQTVIIIFR